MSPYPMSVSNTPCVFMSLVPVSLQSTPRHGFFSYHQGHSQQALEH